MRQPLVPDLQAAPSPLDCLAGGGDALLAREASVKFTDWDLAVAERESLRAIELNPNFVYAHTRYANILLPQGRFAEARRAQELDPLSPQASNSLGGIFYYARLYDEALGHYRKALELSGNNGINRVAIGRVLIQKGKYDEAMAEFRQALAADQQPTYRAWLAYGYARAGQPNEALKLLRELEAQARHERISPVFLARICVGLGEKERALDWLQKGCDEHSDHVLNMGQDPVYDPLRSAPRFVGMLRGIGLAQ